MDLEADLRGLLLAELVDHTSSPDRLADLDTCELLGVYGNWTNRFPSAEPRKVHRSRELDRFLRGSGVLAPQVRQVLTEFESGVDIEFRLSKDVDVAWVAPDRSKRDRLRQLDRYLAAWGIHHLHLGPPDPGTGRAQSSDLLYVVFVDDHVFALATRPHRAWHRDELLHIAADNWPEGGPLHTSNFVLGLEREYDEAERTALFRANVAVPFTRNGRVYSALDHMSLAGTSLNAQQWANQTYYDLQGAIKRVVEAPEVVVAALHRRFPRRDVVSPSWAVVVRARGFVLIDASTGAYLPLAEVATARG